MSRNLRWGIGLLLIAGLLLGAFFFLPFRSWLPGGTVGDIPTREVVNGSNFNRLFPRPQPGEELVFTQEKRGFSQARLKRGDEVKALLSISDVTTAPASRGKFQHSSEQLQSWPLVDQGTQASALLVADRFQVKVIGQGSGLDLQQRHELLGAFDLPGLAALSPALKPATNARNRPALPPGQGEPVRPRVREREPQLSRVPAVLNRSNAVLEPAA
jgi:hypothetical protein